MSDGTQLKTWVTRETKERFAAVARHQGLSDSALLKRLVDLMLRSTDPASYDASTSAEPEPTRSIRLTVRLRPDDELLLRARAAARGMAPATYLSVLTRADLRSLAPLPKEELLALKRSVSNTAWKARERAADAWQERHGESAPEGFRRVRVHDLKPTFGRRLRAADVSFEDRQDLLEHKSARAVASRRTTHRRS